MIDHMSSGKQLTIVVVLLLAVAPVAGVVAPVVGTATAQDGGDETAATEIDSCTVIDQPGSYVLTEDITNSSARVCIDIQSSDVSFDGNGHLVAGNLSREEINASTAGPPPRDRVGVGVNVRTSERVSNVTVSNVTVSNWYHGVLSENVSGGSTSGITAYDNGGGIIYDNSSDVSITDSNSSNNLILGVIVDSRAGVPNANNTVANNTLLNNPAFGAAVFLSNNSTVANNTVKGSGFAGIAAVGTSNSTFTDNTVTNAGIVGLLLEGERPNETTLPAPVEEPEPRAPSTTSRDNVVSGNQLTGSGIAGLAVVHSDDNRVVNNDVSNTGPAPFPFLPFGSAGIVAEDASGNLIVNTTATGEADFAYAAINNSTNRVRNLTTETARVSFEGTDVGVGAARSLPPLPDNQVATGNAVDTAKLSDDGSLSLVFHYDENVLADRNLNERSLNVYRFSDRRMWEVVCEGYTLDTERNTVAVDVTEFGIHAVFANEDPNSTST